MHVFSRHTTSEILFLHKHRPCHRSKLRADRLQSPVQALDRKINRSQAALPVVQAGHQAHQRSLSSGCQTEA